jgi:hypothetical protein
MRLKDRFESKKIQKQTYKPNIITKQQFEIDKLQKALEISGKENKN